MNAITRTPDHVYTYQGVSYPSVTTVLKVLDKSGPLMSWASRMTAEAAVRLAPSLPTLIETTGQDGAIRALMARSNWVNEKARLMGTAVHALADAIATGQPLPAMTETEMAYIDHYERWWRGSKWRLRTSEAMLVNTGLGYAGTLDLLCYDADGRTVLADIKTGKAVYPETTLQLAAYGYAEVIEAPGLGLFPMPPIDRYCVVHVTGEKLEVIEVPIGSAEIKAFAACRDLWEWRESRKGGAL